MNSETPAFRNYWSKVVRQAGNPGFTPAEAWANVRRLILAGAETAP